MPSSFLTNPIFGHEPTRSKFDNGALIKAMIEVEVALANVQADLGLIPSTAANEIAALPQTAQIDLNRLEKGVLETGVPVPALVSELRNQLSPAAADWLHFGATSQDIVDGAICLCAKHALDKIETVSAEVIDQLASLSQEHRETLMLARTRGQLATPITFGLRSAQWAQPLISVENELGAVRAAALRIQFGGASGSQSANRGRGPAIASGMAKALGLQDSPPWHTDRSGLQHLAGWLLRLVQALAKVGQDVALSARGEIAELTPSAGGGSSTMPHKSNPVRAEALVAIQTYALACNAGLASSGVHAEERDGSMWSVEWLFLPSLFEATGAALGQTRALLDGLNVQASNMLKRIDTTPAVLSEAAVFALAGKIGRVAAVAEVKETLEGGETLEALLKTHLGPEAAQELAAQAFVEPAADVAQSIFALRRRKDI